MVGGGSGSSSSSTLYPPWPMCACLSHGRHVAGVTWLPSRTGELLDVLDLCRRHGAMVMVHAESGVSP
jgi:hypothetical protein